MRTGENWQANQPAAQGQNQGYDLAHPNIHPICDQLKHMKEPEPQDPKLKVLHNTRQQQDIQEES